VLCLACGAPSGGTEAQSSSGAEDSSSSGAAAMTTTGGGVDPTTGGGSGEGTSGGASSGGECSSEGESGGGFVADCYTELKEQRLGFVCNLPSALVDCEAVEGASCEDVDQDGLTDAWEDLLLGAMRPLRRMDEAEQMIGDPSAVTGDVGRVVMVGDRFRVFVMLGYHYDYGSCGGFTSHNGDSERVALDLAADPAGGPGGVVVAGAYTAAHENTANDHGMVFAGAALDMLVFTPDPQTSRPRWVVYPSADKHATYATIEICEDISAIPCLDEDCAPDDVDDPALFDVLSPFVNAGEEAAPRVGDLAEVGFPGEEAWVEQDFCGGLGGTGCSSSVRYKLTVDPFL